MDNKKMIETIEKKLEVKVEKVLEVKQDGKEVIADVKVGETSCRKVVLKESKNQYGTYYRFVSATLLIVFSAKLIISCLLAPQSCSVFVLSFPDDFFSAFFGSASTFSSYSLAETNL